MTTRACLAPGPVSAGVLGLSMLLTASCGGAAPGAARATPVGVSSGGGSASGAATRTAMAPAAVTGQPNYTPAVEPTRPGPDPAQVQSLMLDETLTSLEERMQAIEKRVDQLPKRQGPERDSEQQATVDDFKAVLEQLQLVAERSGQAEEASRAARAERTSKVTTTVAGLMAAAAKVEGMAERMQPLIAELAMLGKVSPAGTPAPTVATP